MQGAGYLTATKNGFDGEPGQFYNYIMGANGLFIRAENPHIETTILIAPVEIRGLEPVTEYVRLVHGKIPYQVYSAASAIFLRNPDKEVFLAITWSVERNSYLLVNPEQEGTGGGVKYTRPPNVFMDIHSHGVMPAFFSGTDNADEQGFNLSLVIGKVEKEPEYRLRLCCYGYFKEMNFEEVFDGCTTSTTSLPAPVEPGLPSSSDAAEQEDTLRSRLPAFFRRMFKSSWWTSTGSKSGI